jgi:hypothetical protein
LPRSDHQTDKSDLGYIPSPGGAAAILHDNLVALAVLPLNVSVDMLLFNNEQGPAEDLRFHFEAVSKLAPEAKSITGELIEGMLLKHDAKRWTQGSGKKAAQR